MIENEKIYFMPGDLVTLKLELPNKPIMIVVKKETNIFKNTSTELLPVLKGIKCRWFTEDGILLEAIFNTKDLLKVK